MMKWFNRMSKGEGGFTLMEVIVALALLAIIMAIAVPSFLNQRKANVDTQTQTDLEEIVTLIDKSMIRQPGGAVSVTSTNGNVTVNVGGIETTHRAVNSTLNIQIDASNGMYRLAAWDPSGKKYVSAAEALLYESVSKDFSVGAFLP